jgi:cytochrome c biogenesis factor
MLTQNYYHLGSSATIRKSLESAFSFLGPPHRATRHTIVQVFHLCLAAFLLSVIMRQLLRIEQSIAMRQGLMMHAIRFPHLFTKASCISALKSSIETFSLNKI